MGISGKGMADAQSARQLQQACHQRRVDLLMNKQARTGDACPAA